MKRIALSVGLLALLFAANSALAQTVNSQVGGVVQDKTHALIPGVAITLTNTDTGVEGLRTIPASAPSLRIIPKVPSI